MTIACVQNFSLLIFDNLKLTLSLSFYDTKLYKGCVWEVSNDDQIESIFLRNPSEYFMIRVTSFSLVCVYILNKYISISF